MLQLSGILMNRKIVTFLFLFSVLLSFLPHLGLWSTSVSLATSSAMPTIAFTPTLAKVDSITDDKGLGYPDSRKIARDSQGNLYVAYRKKHRSVSTLRYHIFVAKSTDNGASWVVLNHNQPIETTGDYTQRVPSLAIDAQDGLHVVWYGTDAEHTGENDRQIKYTQSLDGGASWQAWQNIGAVPGYQGETLWQEHPIIFVGNNNSLYVAWEGRDAEHARSQVKFTHSSDSGRHWSPWVNVAPDPTLFFSRPTLVATHDGSVLYVLAYAQFDELRQIVWTQSTDGGQTWAKWDRIAADGQDQRHISLAIDNADRLHAVWRQQQSGFFAPSQSQIHYAFFANGAWSAPQRPGENLAMHEFFPSIAVTNLGQVWVTWQATEADFGYPKEDPTPPAIYYAVQSNGSWQPAVQLSSSQRALYPSMAWNPHTQQAAPDIVWLESEGDPVQGMYTIRAATAPLVTRLAIQR